MAVIQRREEEKREEKRRKEIAKQVPYSHRSSIYSSQGTYPVKNVGHRCVVIIYLFCVFAVQERFESMEQPHPPISAFGKSPPSPCGTPPELSEIKKGIGNRRRTTSNSRHRYYGILV